MFDEQPDGDPHGECRAEIENWRGCFMLLASTINPTEDKPAFEAARELLAERDLYRRTLERVATTVWDEQNNPRVYVREVLAAYSISSTKDSI